MIKDFNLSLSKAFFFTKKPFLLFEFKDFFTDEVYVRLRDSFPDQSLLVKEYSDKGKKKYIGSKDSAFEDILNKLPVWKDVEKHFHSPDIVKSFYNLFLEGVDGRPQWQKYEWQLVRAPKNQDFFLKVVKKIRRLIARLRGKTLVYVALEFSFLKDKCYIPPHTDISSKLISLLVYFPDEGHNYSSGGTEFYKGREGAQTSYGWKAHQMSDKDSESFFETHEPFYIAKFEENKLLGFVKTAYSWHGLRPISLPRNFSRRCLGINYYLY